jgi:uncharacterized protein YlzI (FlbEa/FlbD family)
MPEYRVFERSDGRKAAVNPELVEAVVEGAGKASGQVLIRLSSGEYITVKMSLEEVIERLHHHHDLPKKPTKIR